MGEVEPEPRTASVTHKNTVVPRKCLLNECDRRSGGGQGSDLTQCEGESFSFVLTDPLGHCTR